MAVKYPNRTDEMVSAVMETITVCIRRIAEGKLDSYGPSERYDNKIPNVGGYIASSCRWILKNLVSRNKTLEVTTVEPEAGKVGEDESELERIIGECATTNREIEITHLLVKGHKPSEVAKILGVHRQYVTNVRTRIQKRLKEKLGTGN